MTRLAWLCALLLGASAFAADQRPEYEEALVARALERHGLRIDAHPEGKKIAFITIDSSDVVSPEDPWPDLLNIFHVTTKDRTVRRELLVHEGDTYSRERVSESERNLRGMFILAAARVVPVEAPDGVGVLVVTKDLWSLRLNSAYSYAGGLLQALRLQPTEQNFLGLNKQVSLTFLLTLDQLSFGQSYVDRRFLGHALAFSESAAVILNRNGSLEGSTGGASFGHPLYSLEDEWAWSVSSSWTVDRVRTYQGANVLLVDYPNDTVPTARIPFIYDARVFGGAASVTRSLGTTEKLNLTGTLGGYDNRYTAPAQLELTAAEYQFMLDHAYPRNEKAIYLQGTAQAFEPRYAVMHDLDTFGVSEDVRLGHTALVSARWADKAFFSPVRFVDLGLSLRYRWLAADNLLSVEGAGAARWQPGISGPDLHGPWVNRRIAFEFLNYSPVIGIGRIVTRALVDAKAEDLNHVPLFVGGAEGLRGTPPEAQTGNKVLLVNLEYRTLPIVVRSVHAGLVFFYDAGSAFTSSPNVQHTIGIGARILLPQFNRVPIRIDVGWVLNGPQPALSDRFSSTYGQITDFRPGFLDSPI